MDTIMDTISSIQRAHVINYSIAGNSIYMLLVNLCSNPMVSISGKSTL